MPLLVGTSGWQYADWRGPFYPREVPQRLWFDHLLVGFRTVEVNLTFYRLPARTVFESWCARSPADAIITVKASRFLTHIKRLRDPAEPVARLMDRAAGLGGKLGPVLLQLPPDLPVNVALLERCLARFPAGVRVAVEPRHPSWWTPELAAVLSSYGAALVWADRRGPITPLWRTAAWGYLRLHEGRATTWPRYGRQALASWVDRLAASYDDTEDVFVYFNNDPGCAAVVDAVSFARQARRRGRTVSRVPGDGPAS